MLEVPSGSNLRDDLKCLCIFIYVGMCVSGFYFSNLDSFYFFFLFFKNFFFFFHWRIDALQCCVSLCCTAK